MQNSAILRPVEDRLTGMVPPSPDLGSCDELLLEVEVPFGTVAGRGGFLVDNQGMLIREAKDRLEQMLAEI